MKKFLVASLLFLNGFAHAALFDPRTKYEELTDWSGGLATTVDSGKLDKKFSPYMRNVFVHRQPGTVLSRKGYEEVGSTTSLQAGRFIFTFSREDGNTEFLVSDSSQVFSTRDFQTYVFISSALNTNVLLDCAQVRNKAWCTNGQDPVFTWDGSAKVVLDGLNGTPNVPRGRYIEYDQERVWIGNTSGNGSSLNWSDVVSTNAIAIAPDNFLAWPTVNQLNIGQGDGQVITSLWVLKGQLQVGKTRSIYTRYGTSNTSYFARKTDSQTGPISNDAVGISDGLVYFKALDGIYKFNGDTSIRISDLIVPDVAAMLNPVNLTVQNSWETRDDFAQGTFYASTASLSGLLTPHNTNKNIIPTGTLDGSGGGGLSSGTTFYGWKQLTFNTNQVSNGYGGYAYQVVTNMNRAVEFATNTPTTALLYLYNGRTGVMTTTTSIIGTPGGATHEFNFTTQHPVFLGSDVNLSSFNIKIENLFPTSGFDGININSLTGWTIRLNPATTGQFISEPAAIQNTITAWGNFSSVNTTNGGAVSFAIRTSTSEVNISTRTWVPIIPGVRINAPTIEKYVQWATTIAAISTGNPANVDSVSIDHIEGSGSSDRPFAIIWNNEYWLSVATESSGLFSLQYVKSWVTNSNPDAWNPLSGINIRSFAKDGETTLYAGATDRGAFYRLDYGTNDNGLPIDSFYDTPDMDFGATFLDKFLQKVNISCDNQVGANLRLGLSVNGGAFTFNSIPLTNSSKIIRPVDGILGKGNSFRFRIQVNGLDKTMAFHNLGLWYLPQDILTNTQ